MVGELSDLCLNDSLEAEVKICYPSIIQFWHLSHDTAVHTLIVRPGRGNSPMHLRGVVGSHYTYISSTTI